MRLFPCLLLFALPAVAAAPGEVTEELVLRHHSAAEVAGWFSPQPHREYALSLPAGVTEVRGEDYSSVLTVTGEADGVALLREVIHRLDSPPRQAVVTWWYYRLSGEQAAAAEELAAPALEVDGRTAPALVVRIAPLRAGLEAMRSAPPWLGGRLWITSGRVCTIPIDDSPYMLVPYISSGRVLITVGEQIGAVEGAAERLGQWLIRTEAGEGVILRAGPDGGAGGGIFVLVEHELAESLPPAALSRLAREWIELEIRRLGRLTVRHLDPDDVENLRLALTRPAPIATIGIAPEW